MTRCVPVLATIVYCPTCSTKMQPVETVATYECPSCSLVVGAKEAHTKHAVVVLERCPVPYSLPTPRSPRPVSKTKVRGLYVKIWSS